jgi:hypothetical protein
MKKENQNYVKVSCQFTWFRDHVSPKGVEMSVYKLVNPSKELLETIDSIKDIGWRLRESDEGGGEAIVFYSSADLCTDGQTVDAHAIVNEKGKLSFRIATTRTRAKLERLQAELRGIENPFLVQAYVGSVFAQPAQPAQPQRVAQPAQPVEEVPTMSPE